VVGLTVAVAACFWIGATLGSRPNPRVLYESALEERASAEAALQAGELEPAGRLGRHAVEALDKLLGYWPLERRYKRERAKVRQLLGAIEARREEPGLADIEFKRAVDDWARLLAHDQTIVEDRRWMGECLYQLGTMYLDVGRWDEAEAVFRRGRALCASTPARAARDRRIDQQWVEFLNQHGLLLVKLGHWEEAAECRARAVGVQQMLVKSYSEQVEDRERLIALLITQAEGLTLAKERRAAEASLTEAIELAERLANQYPAEARHQDLVASSLVKRAELIQTEKARIKEACGLLLRARSIEQGVVDKLPRAAGYRARLATICCGLAGLNRDSGSLDEALAFYREELAHWSLLARDTPEPIRFQLRHGEVLHNLADLLRQLGRWQEALPFEQQAVERLSAVSRDDVRNPEYRRSLSDALWTLCALELDRHDYRAAARAVAGYRQVEQSGYEESLESARFLSQCAAQCAADPTISRTERDQLTRAYQDQAVESMKTAVAAGYSDDHDLKSSPVYTPLRGRDDFERLVRELILRAQYYGPKS
jgi:eukaryotic-like serine/threonine-protein kinase